MDCTTLIRKTIKEIQISDDKTVLCFITDKDEKIWFNINADCCSESWIEHLTYELGTITKVEESDPVDGIGTKQEVDLIYTVRFHFEGYKNILGIEFRNSSNGYYGGSIDLIDETSYDWKRTIDQRNSMKIITDSF